MDQPRAPPKFSSGDAEFSSSDAEFSWDDAEFYLGDAECSSGDGSRPSLPDVFSRDEKSRVMRGTAFL